MELALLALAVVFLAYANGANDNPKGVATLLGSRTAGYRTAIGWAALTTFAGCLGAVLLSRGLLRTFSGAGLVADELVGDPSFLGAVGLAAALTVGLATRLGLPISTTHALTGALVGVGLAASGEIHFGQLLSAFLLPLAVSPLLAVALTVPAYAGARLARLRLGIDRETCVCIGPEVVPLRSLPLVTPSFLGVADAAGIVAPATAAMTTPSTATAATAITVGAGTMVDCTERYRGRLLGLDAQRGLDLLHFASAGAVSFARGLNDAPKIAALLLAASFFDARGGLLMVGLAMMAGGLISTRRVADTVGYRITGMNTGQGFVGNLVTAVLVTGASSIGLPISTTHVSCGALFGIGVANGEAHWGTIGTILGAWLVTLPLAVVIGAGVRLLVA